MFRQQLPNIETCICLQATINVSLWSLVLRVSVREMNRRSVHARVHLCDLPKTSGSNLPKLPPNAKFYTRWRRNLQKLVLVSARHPLARLVLRSQAAISFEKRRHSRSSHRWNIHPCSMVRFYWDTLMVIVFLYTFVTFPYILCFRRIGRSDSAEIWYFMYPAYAICLVDIVLNFITGYVSVDGQEIFLDSNLLIRKYLQGYFFFDLISSIPYTWFYRTRILQPGRDANSALLILECLPCLKIARIVTVRRNIYLLNQHFQFLHVQNLTIWLIILTLLFFHWSGCISFVFPYIILHFERKEIEISDLVFITEEFYNKPCWKVYLIFLHIGASNFTCCSTEEFEKFGLYDLIIRYILVILGRAYGMYLIVVILQFFESVTEPGMKFQRIIYQVKEYGLQKQIPISLQDRFILYYMYSYQNTFFRKSIIHNSLSNYLNHEIRFHSSRGLMETALLHALPRHTMVNLLKALQTIIFLKNSIIYKATSESDCIYFISSGSVALITYSGHEICHLHDGEHFGEIGLIYPDQRRTETVITLEMCELLRLFRRDFKYLFPITSDFYKNLEIIAQKRLKKIQKLEKDNATKREL